MAKTKIVLALTLVVLMAVAVSPGLALAAAPNQPTNVSPADTTTEISLTPLLTASVFQDSDGNDTQYACQWQIRHNAGDYSTPVFDTGVSLAIASPGEALTCQVAEGHLSDNTSYYWHVRYQDNTGWWSTWSSETSFTTIAAGMPTQPVNLSPLDEALEISVTPMLIASAFATVNGVGTHTGSQWQITTTSGDYSSPLHDSGITSGITQVNVPANLLSDNTTYYWHVRYQDKYGRWSDYSEETSFTTIANLPPNQPINIGPADGAENVSLTPLLTASSFADPDGDSHAASRWQISDESGIFTDPLYDSGETTSLTSVIIPSGVLADNTTYYWRVQYEDSRDGWSSWSDETDFTTATAPEPAPPVAEFSASERVVTAGTDVVVFTDASTGDQLVTWEWDFGDGSDNVTWTSVSRPRDGKISHTYAEAGPYTVSLKVTAASGSDVETKDNYVSVNAVPEASFLSLVDGSVVRFSDASVPPEGITTWKWNFGDGTTLQWDATARQAADGKVSHEYEDAGTYMVSLTVTGPLGTHTFNGPVEVAGATGFEFTWWVILAIAGGLAVVGGGAFLVSRRITR